MTNEQLWQAVLGEVELSVSRAGFTTWFKSTFIISAENGDILVAVPNAFAKEWLEKKYHKHILKAMEDVLGEVKSVRYIIKAAAPSQKAGGQAKKTVAGGNSSSVDGVTSFSDNPVIGGLNSALNSSYAFENFIVGSNNELAHAACLAVSKNPGKIYNPLFIYGGVGLGKTHLLQSIGNEILKNDPKKKVRYASSEKFTNELVSAIQNKGTSAFKDVYREIDILIIDDIQFIAGKDKTQQEFFHTFNALYEKGKQIILSSDRPPKAIPELEERLRSRFEGGMIADVSFPDLETRLAILKFKAEEKDFEIPDESLKYIASHIQKNIRELQGALNKVIATCQFHSISPDINNVKKMLADLIASPIKKAITPKEIIAVVAGFYDVSVRDLIKKGRKKEIVKPRQVAMHLMRSETSVSYPNIGERLGGRDHTTVMHAVEKVKKDLETDKILEQEIRLIKERLYA
jgi:chromosomal replication initiator protein